MADPTEEATLEAATRRLERATALLESRFKTFAARAERGDGDAFDHDRAQLATDLDIARAREKELATAGAEASEAMGRVIAGIRSALERAEAH